MVRLPADERRRQELYRDARYTNQYDDIWQSVNKCVFCDLKEKYVFFEENGIVMTISLYAYIDGHFMIVPRRHVRSAKELSQLEWDTIRKFAYIAKKLIKDVHRVRGMQLVQKDGAAAQSTVEHIHFHCIPFDAPDLCQWNYRKLQYTPLENVALYKQERKKILRYDAKFDEKYRNYTSLPVVCDLIAINTRHEVLIGERKTGTKLDPDNLSIIGGHVSDFTVPFEDELAREVYEETGWKLDPHQLTLLSSQVGQVSHTKISKHLKASYSRPSTFVWNTYVAFNVAPDIALRPGDDCSKLLWVPIHDALVHPRLTEGVKKVLKLANDLYKTDDKTQSE